MVRRRQYRWFLRLRYWLADHPKVWLLVPLMILAGGLFLFALVERNLKPTILTLAKEKGIIMATNAIHQTIREKLADSVNPRDLVEYKTDQQGRVVLLQPNAARINRVASETTVAIQEALTSQNDTYFEIPASQILGSNLLAGLGPNLRVRVRPVGTIKVIPEESFEEAGINQTKHTISLHVESVIHIVVPLLSDEVKVATKVPITTTVISGSVPNVFMKGNASTTVPIPVEQKSQ